MSRVWGTSKLYPDYADYTDKTDRRGYSQKPEPQIHSTQITQRDQKADQEADNGKPKKPKTCLKTIQTGSIICTTHNPPEWELSTIPPGMVLQARTEGTPFEPKHFVATVSGQVVAA